MQIRDRLETTTLRQDKNAFIFGFGIFLTILVFIFDLALVSGVVRESATSGYKQTKGRITESTVRWMRVGRKKEPIAALTYTYRVDNSDYVGHRWVAGLADTYCIALKTRFLNAHPPDSDVPVYYLPSAPGSSVLSPGPQMTDLELLLQVIPLHVLAALSLLSGCGRLAATPKLELDGRTGERRISLHRRHPADVTARSLAIASLVCAFALWTAPGSWVSGPLTLLAWTIVLAVTASVWSQAQALAQAGRGDVVVSDDGTSVEYWPLPLQAPVSRSVSELKGLSLIHHLVGREPWHLLELKHTDGTDTLLDTRNGPEARSFYGILRSALKLERAEPKKPQPVTTDANPDLDDW